MTTIRRENWGGKYRIVIRKDGKLLSHSKWSQKLNNRQAVSKFNRDKTLRPDFHIQRLTNVNEVTQQLSEVGFSREQSNRTARRGTIFQASVVINGRRIYSRGRTQQQALNHLGEGVSSQVLGESDTEKGFELMDTRTLRMEKVSYTAIRK